MCHTGKKVFIFTYNEPTLHLFVVWVTRYSSGDSKPYFKLLNYGLNIKTLAPSNEKSCGALDIFQFKIGNLAEPGEHELRLHSNERIINVFSYLLLARNS